MVYRPKAGVIGPASMRILVESQILRTHSSASWPCRLTTNHIVLLSLHTWQDDAIVGLHDNVGWATIVACRAWLAFVSGFGLVDFQRALAATQELVVAKQLAPS